MRISRIGPGRAVESLQAEVQAELIASGVPEEEVVKKEISPDVKWWVVGFDKRAKLMTAAEVQEFIYAGGQPLVLAENQEGGWRDAEKEGFFLVRPEEPVEEEKPAVVEEAQKELEVLSTASDLDLGNPIIAKLETYPDVRLCELADQHKMQVPIFPDGNLDRVSLVKALATAGVV